MIAVDTNLLVYAHRPSVPEYAAAARAIRDAAADGRGWGFPVACVAEFWRLVTHPAAGQWASSPNQARAFIHDMVNAGGAFIWLPTNRFWERLCSAGVQLRVSGGQIFDLQIALIARDNGATEIWTHDANFISVPGLSVRDPLP